MDLDARLAGFVVPEEAPGRPKPPHYHQVQAQRLHSAADNHNHLNLNNHYSMNIQNQQSSPNHTRNSTNSHLHLHNTSSKFNMAKFCSQQPQNASNSSRNPHDSLDPSRDPQNLANRCQRMLVILIQIYAAIVVALSIVYVWSQLQKHSTAAAGHPQTYPVSTDSAGPIMGRQAFETSTFGPSQSDQTTTTMSQAELEQKVHFLSKYLESVAADLIDTRNRLREREKCHCSMACTFNGTRYSDGSSWQSQCDICSCQSGKVSCEPQKCPLVSKCDDGLVQLPGQCCPTCMKRCRYNKTSVKHGETIRPVESPGKECKCNDGSFRCNSTQSLRPQQAKRDKNNININTSTNPNLKNGDATTADHNKGQTAASTATTTTTSKSTETSH